MITHAIFYHVVNTGHLFKTSDHTQISYKVLHNYNNNRRYCIFLFQYDIDYAMNIDVVYTLLLNANYEFK